jgi:hypothetical protein
MINNFFKTTFCDHPNENNMTYFQHLIFSLGFSFQFSIASFYAFIHAFFPNTCTTSSYDYSKLIYDTIERKKLEIAKKNNC